MVFCFVQKFFFGQHKSQNINFFCRGKREKKNPEFNIRLYDKNSKSDFFFSSIKIRIFFQQHWESEYFFRKKPYGVRVDQSLIFSVIFCRSPFVLLSLFIWTLHCLPFFYLRYLIAILVSSNACQTIDYTILLFQVK